MAESDLRTEPMGHDPDSAARGAREAGAIGGAMRERALKEHTYALRAAQVQAILEASSAGVRHGTIAFERGPRGVPDARERSA